MPDRSRSFFKTSRQWQWIKHLVIADYLKPWSTKVGYTTNRIFVVDAFAGAGTYEDPVTGERSDGSPVIAARRAADYRKERPLKSMHVICVEKHADNFRDLEHRMKGFVDDGLVTLHEGPFGKYADEIATRIGPDPALILLDPIGLKSIDAETCRRLLDRSAKTDVFIVIDFSIVHRSAGQLLEDGSPNPALATAAKNAANVDAFFDGDQGWRRVAKQPSLAAIDRERTYLDMYFSDVLGSRYAFKSAYPVRAYFTDTDQAAPEYWLVHACDFIDAAFLMSDEIAKVERELYKRTFETEGTLMGLADYEYDARVDRIVNELDEHTRVWVADAGDSGLRFGDLETSALDRFFGQIKRGAIAKTAKALVRSGEVLREKDSWNAAWTPNERLRLKPPDAKPSG